jgi:type III secretion protein R
MQTVSLPDPFILVVLLVSLSLAPFAAIMVTSFIKFVVVMSLVRSALGVQQIPPNMVINSLALILSFYIMAPVVSTIYEDVKTVEFSKMDTAQLEEVGKRMKKPIVQFLTKHSHERERLFFMDSARSIWPKDKAEQIREDDIMVLVPAFTTTELTAAFQIGFLLYLPFVIIDIVISNILLAMGMMMVSPMTISLPFKLLLFVVLDGWSRLIHGLVLTYS